MGKKKHSHVIQETDPETPDVFGKKGEDTESSEIIQFVKQSKKKKVKSEPISTNQSDDSLPIESSKVKKLRFNIDGETVEAVKDKEDKAGKKKIKKPRWTKERKAEEKKRKSTEPPTGEQEEEQPKAKIKKHKHKRKEVPKNQTNSNDLPTSAIQYLQTWQYDRSSWKFSKIKQIWLLKNIFDLRKVPSSIFPVLVEYVSGSQGGARLKTYKAASKIIENLEEKIGGEAKTEEEEIARCLTEDSEEDKEEIHQRARSIMQALSDCT